MSLFTKSLVVLIWLSLVGIGYSSTLIYSYSGKTQPNVIQQATTTKNVHNLSKYHLDCYIHPMCPCSRATIEELRELAERHSSQLQITFHVYTPIEVPQRWSPESCISSIQTIKNSVIAADINGRDAEKWVLMFQDTVNCFRLKVNMCLAEGSPPERGHRGINKGINTIKEILDAKHLDTTITSMVYGCTIR